MPLTIGTRVGPYEVLSPIGKGGMGEVYRARDTKLGRDVAIKVLPDELAGDEKRVARFEREAKLLASLNHPNIASVFGFEESDGVKALVLELVEGPTLARRIDRGPIPVDEAVAIAKQITEALEAGHEAGVIHRDLKPANVKLREDGTVKVLDYGLAKALEGDVTDGADSELSQSPTLTRQGTQIGVILGTAAYMSPEQAKGKRVDKRTDIWAFGAVLYEMLAGKRPFPGSDVPELLAAVIKSDPDWEALPPTTPFGIRRLMERCLRKDPRVRLRDIGDARIELDEPTIAPVVAESKPTLARLGLLLALAAAAGALVVWASRRSERDAARAVVRTTIDLPREHSLAGIASVSIAPDGSRVVYTATDRRGDRRLFRRELDELESRPIAGTEGALAPFFSPDGQSIGFSVAGSLMRTALSDGVPVVICEDCALLALADWGPDDTILFRGRHHGIARVPATGGDIETVTQMDPSVEQFHAFPRWLPGGRGFVFVIRSHEGSVVALHSFETNERRLVDATEGSSQAFFVDTGHLIYAKEQEVLAVPFDLETLAATGQPTLVLDGLRERIQQGIGVVDLALSSQGSLIYAEGPSDIGGRQLVRKDREVNETTLVEDVGDYRYVALSRDGGRLAYTDREESGRPDIWILDLERRTKTRFTTRGGNINPLWSRDGERIAFGSTRRGWMDVHWKPTTRAGEAVPLFPYSANRAVGSWSPDGESLLVREGLGPSADVVRASFDGTVEPVLTSEFREDQPRLSPDGRWLAFLSDPSGRDEVYVTSYPDIGEKVLVSSEGALHLVWSGDGTELFYATASALMVVAVTSDSTLRVGRPQKLFDLRTESSREGDFGDFTFDPWFDVSPDGKRFVLTKRASADGETKLRLVQNWVEELLGSPR